ncbi:MAG: hypothetical protein ACD_73C00649G0001 [uncultured bacterium]|nr:MAG: hypothetical protein ACD_73C00649G0001 [uncultured bacterium]
MAISSISIWEVGIKLKKGHLVYEPGLSDYLSRLKKMQNFYILPVDELIWVKNIQLDWKHQDPADRTIVATALHHKIPLITKDKLIRKFYQKTIW